MQTGEFGRNGRVYRVACRLALGAGCLALANCAGNNVASRVGADRDVAARAAYEPVAAQEQAAVQRTQKPDAAVTQRRVPRDNVNYSAVGLASWYGADFHGRRTADGEIFDMNSLTAAHPTLPLPCRVRVTNLSNRRSLVVRVNDRGPFAASRLIDVSARTAKLLGFYDHGVARVKIDYVGRAASPAAARITASAAPL